jgi:hypothetical protein
MPTRSEATSIGGNRIKGKHFGIVADVLSHLFGLLFFRFSYLSESRR